MFNRPTLLNHLNTTAKLTFEISVALLQLPYFGKVIRYRKKAFFRADLQLPGLHFYYNKEKTIRKKTTNIYITKLSNKLIN